MKTKNQKNNRPKSKNNPNGKRNDLKVDWKEYNKRYQAKGVNRNDNMRRIVGMTRKEFGIEDGVRDMRVSAILVSIVKSENQLSYWNLTNHFVKYPNDVELCELKKPYKKSWYHLRISEIDEDVLKRIIARMGDEGADGTLMVDSSGFSLSSYKSWINAKYGQISVKEYDKLHIIQNIYGKICAAIVTEGEANDSPVLREMLSDLRPGTGGQLLGDSAYCNKTNCAAVSDTGRVPILMPKSNCVIKGYSSYADMLRSREAHPGTFYKKIAKRSNVESTFSSIKRRSGGIVRARKKHTRTIELSSMTICYNMIA